MANKNLENILQKLHNASSESKDEVTPLSDEEAEAIEGGEVNLSCTTTNQSCGPNSACGAGPK